MRKQACALLAALVLSAMPALGQGWNVDLVSTKYQGWQDAEVITCQGDYAYVGVNSTSLVNSAFAVVNISHPENPIEVAYCDLDVTADVKAIEVVGNYAYVGFGAYQGWNIMDVATPENPFVAFCSPTPTSIHDICAADVLIYIIHYISYNSSGMMIYDVSNPVQPVLLSHYVLPGPGKYIAVAGGYAYVTQDYGGLCVLDVSDPTLPLQVGALGLEMPAYDVEVVGDYAYISAGVGSLSLGAFYVADVSNPLAPRLVGSLNVSGTQNGLRQLEISGEVACVNTLTEGFYTLGISQPSNPIILGFWDPGLTGACLCDLAQVGDRVYAAFEYSGLKVINVANPQAPQYICSYDPTWNILDVATAGNFAYLAAEDDGLLINDISDPSHPWQPGFLNTIGSAWAVQIYGDYAYVQTYANGLKIVDVSDPSHPQAAGSYNLQGGSIQEIVNHLAYATASDGDLKILDLSSPTNPVQIGFYALPNGSVGELDTDGRFLYSIARFPEDRIYWIDSLLILDVNDPTAPQFLGLFALGGWSHVLALGEGYLYVAGEDCGFRIFNVFDPASPIQVGQLAMPGWPSDMQVSGHFVYLTADAFGMGLRIIDVSQPTSPALAGYYDTPASACAVAVNGDYAYVADWAHFQIYDCSDALHNDVSLTLTPLIQPIQIPVSGGSFDFYLFANNSGPGNQTMDLWTKVILPGGSVISPILGPVSVSLDSGTTGWIRHQNVPARVPAGQYTYIACAGGYPNSIWASDSLQFTKLASGDGKSGAGDWSCDEIEESASLGTYNLELRISPNPFNPTTALRFELREASHASLKIYDVAGKLVATLMDGWREAGVHEVTFDGSNLSSGVYLYHLQAGEFNASGKMLLLK